MISIDQLTLRPVASLNQNLGLYQFITEKKPYPFESEALRMFNQGIVIYETKLAPNKSYKVNITVNDFAVLTIDGKLDRILNRSDFKHYINQNISCASDSAC